MGNGVLVQLFGSAAVAGVLGAIINGIINRKKLGAEATNIITTAAGGLIERLEAELARKDQRIRDLEDRQDETERHLRRSERDHHRQIQEIREILEVHAAWDFRLVSALEESLGKKTDLRPPPPLLPPSLMGE